MHYCITSRYLVGSTYVWYNSKHGTIHRLTLHCLQLYVEVFLPRPFLKLQTTHSNCLVVPLCRCSALVGMWRSVKRAQGGRECLHVWSEVPTSFMLIPLLFSSSVASTIRNCKWDSCYEGLLESLYRIYELTIVTSTKWKKAIFHHFIVRWLNP